MDSPLPDTAAEEADSQPATDGPMGLAAVPCSAICGHCGRRRDQHFFEDEIYCFEHTNGDLWTDEPGWENIGAMIESEYPVLWKEMVAKWKEDNGHDPQNAEVCQPEGGKKL